MKIRNSFVSNSSTSSFVCDVCGRSETTFDGCLDDVDMFECVNGHSVCNDEMLEETETEEERNKREDDYERRWSEKFCPICQFLVLGNSDVARYLFKLTGITEQEVLAEIKKVNKRRKKVYDSEYNMYAAVKAGIDLTDLPKKLKEKYGTYRNFLDAMGK